jgi:hypothetical protein
MSGRFITYVIIGVAFGFTQLWFAFWVVKLFKEKQRILAARAAAAKASKTGTRAGAAKAARRADTAKAEPPAGG